MLKFKLLAPHIPMRIFPVQVENQRAGALIMWEPCRIERKESGKVIVAGSQTRVVPIGGHERHREQRSACLG